MRSVGSRTLNFSLVLALSVSVAAGCGREADDERAEGDAPAGESKESARSFPSELAKRGCDLLTPELAAESLGVQPEELRQIKVLGCVYTRKSGDEVAEASITHIRVLEDSERAKARFQTATRNVEREEGAAAARAISEEAAEREGVEGTTRGKAAEKLGEAMAGMIPAEGFRFDDVAGVGDEARVGRHDGSLTVRVGNMLFSVSAYKGPRPPPPTSRDLSAVVAEAKAINVRWVAETFEARRDMAATLAKDIIERLDAL